jgi:hypothetical protein
VPFIIIIIILFFTPGAKRKKWDVRERPDPPAAKQQQDVTKTSKPKVAAVSLLEMTRAFGHSNRIPLGVDPKSFEALKYCKYLRPYSPKKRTRRDTSRKRSRAKLIQ